MLRYTTDRARPGLVAFYDIRPRNGAGLFLQPRTRNSAFIFQRCSVVKMLWDAGERRSPTFSLFPVTFRHLKYPKDARKQYGDDEGR